MKDTMKSEKGNEGGSSALSFSELSPRQIGIMARAYEEWVRLNDTFGYQMRHFEELRRDLRKRGIPGEFLLSSAGIIEAYSFAHANVCSGGTS